MVSSSTPKEKGVQINKLLKKLPVSTNKDPIVHLLIRARFLLLTTTNYLADPFNTINDRVEWKRIGLANQQSDSGPAEVPVTKLNTY